ncbi:MAG: hypothetical protein J6Q28_01805 [Alistipes sp.]|nr:hypothetical protein [Alistipes sp.]
MRRLLCLASVALLMVGCGNNKRSNDANSEEVAVPTVLPHELTANKDAAFAKKKNIQIPNAVSEKNNKEEGNK